MLEQEKRELESKLVLLGTSSNGSNRREQTPDDDMGTEDLRGQVENIFFAACIFNIIFNRYTVVIKILV